MTEDDLTFVLYAIITPVNANSKILLITYNLFYLQDVCMSISIPVRERRGTFGYMIDDPFLCLKRTHIKMRGETAILVVEARKLPSLP